MEQEKPESAPPKDISSRALHLLDQPVVVLGCTHLSSPNPCVLWFSSEAVEADRHELECGLSHSFICSSRTMSTIFGGSNENENVIKKL